jgi:hypothetical protein
MTYDGLITREGRRWRITVDHDGRRVGTGIRVTKRRAIAFANDLVTQDKRARAAHVRATIRRLQK